MLVECGHVKATDTNGRDWSFCPSFARIASLGSPPEIVKLYADLHGPRATEAARHVLHCLCEQESAHDLLGWLDDEMLWHDGLMPASEQIIIAKHLMQHGIIGRAKPGKGDGQYATEFHVAEYVSAARVHLGLSSADAEALSMTEFQMLFEMKYPEMKKHEAPSQDEYAEAIKALEAIRDKALKKPTP